MLPTPLHSCAICKEETGCTEYGIMFICGRAACWLAAMRAHLSL
jgi:hypothetical protein